MRFLFFFPNDKLNRSRKNSFQVSWNKFFEGAIFGFTAERSWRAQIYGLAVSFKELLETVGKIYCQGKRTTKKQAVCLELGPLCSIAEFPLPTQPPPPAGVIRGAFTDAVQSCLTFSIKLLTFSGLTCAITYKLAKRSSEMQNLFEFARTTENLNTRGAIRLCRFFSPAMSRGSQWGSGFYG